MSRINRRRALPPIPHDANPQLRQYLQSQQEITEIGEGVRGDPLDRKLTIRDLVNAGIVKLKGALGKYIDPNNMEPGDKVGNNIKDMAIPPRPRGVQAAAVIGANVIFWDNPAKQYNNHSHAEVWRTETPNAFDTAVLIGTSAGSSYTDYTVIGGTKYTYWVRFISTSDVEGPLHSPQGIQIEAVKTAEQILRELNEEFANTDPSAGNLQEDFIIDARRFAIRTGATGQTKIPFAVLSNGTVVMQNVLINQGILGPIGFGKIIGSDGLPVTNVAGRLKADYIDAQNLSVKEAADFTGDLQSTNFLTGVQGWRLRKTGDIELNGAQIRGLLDFGQITVKGRPPSEVKTLNSVTASASVSQSSSSTTASVSFLDSTPTGRIDLRSDLNISLNISGTIRSGRIDIWDDNSIAGFVYVPSYVRIQATVSVYVLINGTAQKTVARRTVTFDRRSSGANRNTETVNTTVPEFDAFSALSHVGEVSSASVSYWVEVSVQRSAQSSDGGSVSVNATVTATTGNTYAYLNRF